MHSSNDTRRRSHPRSMQRHAGKYYGAHSVDELTSGPFMGSGR